MMAFFVTIQNWISEVIGYCRTWTTLLNAKTILLASTLAALAAASGLVMSAPHGMSLGRTEGKDLAPDAGRDALRQIVQNQCVLNWTQHHDPAPCERVFLADEKNQDSGYAILADKKGAAHYLLIPTQTMHGVDAQELLDPDLPNYFSQAWKARDVITKFVGHPVLRSAIGLAVNNAHSRTQDQFHIHIDCLRQDVADSLHAAAENVTTSWGPVTVMGSTYQAMRIEDVSLDGASPFELVAKIGPDVRHHLGDYTVVVAGMQYKSGAGFMLLAGTGPTGELLLDSACTVAGGPV
jgi:CDP-diacylglycerol pyrophosphatase